MSKMIDFYYFKREVCNFYSQNGDDEELHYSIYIDNSHISRSYVEVEFNISNVHITYSYGLDNYEYKSTERRIKKADELMRELSKDLAVIEKELKG